MKSTVLVTCELKQEQSSFFASLLANKQKGQIDIKRLARKLSSSSVHMKQNATQAVSEGLNSNDKQQRSLIQLTKTRIKGNFVINQFGRAHIYGCQTVSDAYKFALLTMRDINRVLKMDLKMTNFKVQKIKTEYSLGEKLDLSIFKNYQMNKKEMIKDNQLIGLQLSDQSQHKRCRVTANGTITIEGRQEEQIKNRYLSILRLVQTAAEKEPTKQESNVQVTC